MFLFQFGNFLWISVCGFSVRFFVVNSFNFSSCSIRAFRCLFNTLNVFCVADSVDVSSNWMILCNLVVQHVHVLQRKKKGKKANILLILFIFYGLPSFMSFISLCISAHQMGISISGPTKFD